MNRIQTPLRVTHSLVMEVWFSVQGEDEWGNACEEYKTRVRTLTLRKAVMIPSVSQTESIELTAVCSHPRIRRSTNLCAYLTLFPLNDSDTQMKAQKPHQFLPEQTFHVSCAAEISRQTTTKPKCNLPNNVTIPTPQVNFQRENARSAARILCYQDRECGGIVRVD